MSGGGSARKEINMDNKAYQKMDYALCLLSAAADGKRHGCIVNSFHQVTSSFPPKFTVAVNKDHETCKAIQAAGSFSVTLLGADAPGEIIDLFGEEPKILASFGKDTSDNYQDGLLELYKKIRPGEPLSVDSAESLLNSCLLYTSLSPRD